MFNIAAFLGPDTLLRFLWVTARCVVCEMLQHQAADGFEIFNVEGKNESGAIRPCWIIVFWQVAVSSVLHFTLFGSHSFLITVIILW